MAPAMVDNDDESLCSGGSDAWLELAPADAEGVADSVRGDSCYSAFVDDESLICMQIILEVILQICIG